MATTRFFVIAGMILAAAASRLLPHPPNFTPVAAMALFAGATLPRRWLAFLVPLAAMVLSDIVIYHSHSERPELAGYLAHRAVVYACFAVMVCMGFWLRNRRKVLPIAGAALAGSVLFFVVTNFAVWAMHQGLSFPRTWEGLIACYTVAIPFYQNTLLGDLTYAAVLFGGFALVEYWLPSLSDAVLAPAEQKGYVFAEK